MRTGSSTGRRALWLSLAICVFGFAVLAVQSQRMAAVVLAATGAMVLFAVLRMGPVLAGGTRVVTTRLRAVLHRKREPAFETLPVALLRFTSDGALIVANAAARQLIGPTGRHRMAHDVFEDMGRPVTEWLRDVASGTHPGGAEVLRLTQSRDPNSFVQMTVQRLGEDEVLAVVQDATAMKRLEAQFTQSQKMQAVGQLAGGIAHDFNNLLTAITGHCDLLLLRHHPDDLDHDDLRQIQQNANRAGALVRQLLAFSRKQTMVPERFDLAEVLGQVAHFLKRLFSSSVRLDLDHVTVPLTLRVDKSQFEQVMINLAVNARDAMPLGGLLRIDTECITLETAMQRDRAMVPAGQYAVIRVRDSGTGIAPDVMDKIFEPFFTTKKLGEGTGLGLATVYGIVKQSGGYVFVTSIVGEGTEFQLWFPASKAEAPRARAAPAVVQRIASAQGVVLLVEDEAPVRAFAARALRLRGLTVIEAETGEQALDLLAGPLRVDLLLSDVMLPGLDGPQWVRQALVGRPGLPVVFMSGYAAESPAQAQASIENSLFLPKPFTLVELCETVTKQLRNSDQPAAGLPADTLSVS